MHGGPPSALLMRAVEAAEAPDGITMAVARLTVELLRPIPLEPLVVRAEVVRPGRRVQLIEAAIHHAGSGAELVRARALRIREASVPLPYEDPVRGPLLVPEGPPPPPDTGVPSEPAVDSDVAFHQERHRSPLRRGDVEGAGPGDHVGSAAGAAGGGEEPSPLQRTAALSDMGNGVSGVVGFDTHLFINPELTIHLWRVPAKE